MADVLVVDDDVGVTILLGLHLQARGHHVRSRATVEDALLASVTHRPDVLLVDVDLGDRSGADLVELLDRGLGRPRVTCLLSSRPDADLDDLADRLGVVWLRKPVEPAALDRVIDMADPDLGGDG